MERPERRRRHRELRAHADLGQHRHAFPELRSLGGGRRPARPATSRPSGSRRSTASSCSARTWTANQYFADPILTGVDQRELGFYVAVLQDIGPVRRRRLPLRPLRPELQRVRQAGRTAPALQRGDQDRLAAHRSDAARSRAARLPVRHRPERARAHGGGRADESQGQRLDAAPAGAAMTLRARAASASLAAFAASASLAAAACDVGQGPRQASDEPLAVANAQFISGRPAGPLPGRRAPVAADAGPRPLTVARRVFAGFGRSSRAGGNSVSGSVTDDTAAVGVRLVDQGTGYWVVPAGVADLTMTNALDVRRHRELRHRTIRRASTRSGSWRSAASGAGGIPVRSRRCASSRESPTTATPASRASPRRRRCSRSSGTRTSISISTS